LDCLSYDILMLNLSFFNFVRSSRVRYSNLALTGSIKDLAKGIELRLFYYIIGEVSYDNKRNQGFCNNY
jgi:hypothetical protein